MINKDLGFNLPKRNEIFNEEKYQRIKNFGLEIIQIFEEITSKLTKKFDDYKKNTTNVKKFNFLKFKIFRKKEKQIVLIQANPLLILKITNTITKRHLRNWN